MLSGEFLSLFWKYLQFNTEGDITGISDDAPDEAKKAFRHTGRMIDMFRWCKNNPDDKIWWKDTSEKCIGEWVFSFDKKTEFNMFRDYPHALTSEQKKIFDEENPYWKEFFKDRI